MASYCIAAFQSKAHENWKININDDDDDDAQNSSFIHQFCSGSCSSTLMRWMRMRCALHRSLSVQWKYPIELGSFFFSSFFVCVTSAGWAKAEYTFIGYWLFIFINSQMRNWMRLGKGKCYYPSSVKNYDLIQFRFTFSNNRITVLTRYHFACNCCLLCAV